MEQTLTFPARKKDQKIHFPVFPTLFFTFYRAALPGTNTAAPRLYADVAAAVDFSINNPVQTGFFHVPVALSLNRTIAAVHYSVCPSTIHILKQVDFYVNNICAFYLPNNTISNDKYTKVLSLFFALQTDPVIPFIPY